MKMLNKIILLIMIKLLIFSLISNTQTNAFASSSLSTNTRKIVNIVVLLPSFDDFYSMQLKQNFENIQKEKENQVKFTFYDGKNNISVQSETLDSIRQNNIDLVIANLADSKENAVEDIILKVKQSNIPIIFLGVGPQVIEKVSKLYDKVIFTLPNSQEAGTIEGNILVNLWNINKKAIDRNNDNTIQYILLKGETNNIVAIERTEYAISAINNSGIQTEQLALINANWSKELAKNAIESLFLRYAGKIEAIISNNDAMALGAIEALQKYGYNKGDKSKQISIVGIDAIPEARDLVDKGLLTGTVIQDPKMVAEGFYTIGMNLINNLPPLENTNFHFKSGAIMLPENYEEYVGKPAL